MISPQRIQHEAAEVMRFAKLKPVPVVFYRPLDEEHAMNPRRYAQVRLGDARMEFARAVVELSPAHRLGLYAHETGHLLDPEGGEDEADAAALQVLGVRIAYDHRWPGKGLQYAASAPLELWAVVFGA